MGLRPTKVDEDAKWGTPLDPLFGGRSHFQLADVGVGLGPGGPPHLASSTESAPFPLPPYRAWCAINSTKNVRPGWGIVSTAGFSAIGSE